MTGKKYIFRAGLQFFQGDWSFFKNVMKLRGWKEGPNLRCCWKCPCDHDSMYKCIHNAPWRGRSFTQADWIYEMMTSQKLFPLMAIPGILLCYVTADLMHAGDLGVLPIILGNVIWDIFKNLGGSLKNNTDALACIMNMIKIGAKRLKIEPPINTLTMNMVKRSGKKPLLKTKAAESRHMLRVIGVILLAPGLTLDKGIFSASFFRRVFLY